MSDDDDNDGRFDFGEEPSHSENENEEDGENRAMAPLLSAAVEEGGGSQFGGLLEEGLKGLDAELDNDGLPDPQLVVEIRENFYMDGDAAQADAGDRMPEPEERVPNAKRVTRRILSKYERTRILGTRATQIAMGAAPVVQAEDQTDPLRIAELELKDYKIPLIIRRYLPDGSFEDWTVEELNPARQAELDPSE